MNSVASWCKENTSRSMSVSSSVCKDGNSKWKLFKNSDDHNKNVFRGGIKFLNSAYIYKSMLVSLIIGVLLLYRRSFPNKNFSNNWTSTSKTGEIH